MKTLKNSIIVLLTITLFSSCASLYDPVTHAETVNTKAAALNLMDQSTDAFSNHMAEVTQFKQKLAKRLNYEKAKKNNQITTKMWEVLNNDNKLIKSYLKLWEEKGTLSPFFINEAKPQISEAFDLLIEYEDKKDRKGVIQNFIDNL